MKFNFNAPVIVSLLSLAFIDIQADETNLVATWDIKGPAFLSFIKSVRQESGQDLMVTQFGEFTTGNVDLYEDIDQAYSTGRTIEPTMVGTSFTWPNIAVVAPPTLLSSTESSILCSGSDNNSSSDCVVMIVPDGFLTPGHKTGGLYFLPVSTTAGAPVLPQHAIAVQEDSWFYHQAHFYDMNGDGLMDIIAARCHINMVGQSKGELLWFEHPSNPKLISSTWTSHKLADGPDVISLIQEGSDGQLYIFAAQFFSKKLSMTTLKAVSGK